MRKSLLYSLAFSFCVAAGYAQTPRPAATKTPKIHAPNETVEQRRQILIDFENHRHEQRLKLMEEPVRMIIAAYDKKYPFLAELRTMDNAAYKAWQSEALNLFLDEERNRNKRNIEEIRKSHPPKQEMTALMRHLSEGDVEKVSLIGPLNRAREAYALANNGVMPSQEKGGPPPIQYIPVKAP